MTSQSTTTPTDPLLAAAGRELEEYEARKAKQAPLTPAIADAAKPLSRRALEAQEFQELESSEVYATLDHLYCAPKFPVATCRRVTDLRKDRWWISMLVYARWRGIVLDSDALDAHVRWMRDIIAYLRYHEVLPVEYTSDRAATRIVTALAHQHRFRQHMRNLRAASLSAFPDLLADVLAYICYNHDCAPYERRHKRRVFVPVEEEPSDPESSNQAVKRGRTTASESSNCDPPPFKAKLHETGLENLGDDDSCSKWNRVVFDTFGQAHELKKEGAPAPQRRLGVLQTIFRLIKEQQCTEMPYFDGMSEARLRDVLEKDVAFTAAMDELLRSADSDYRSFEPAMRRIVNHVCQPRKRTSGSSRRVRFAPF